MIRLEVKAPYDVELCQQYQSWYELDGWPPPWSTHGAAVLARSETFSGLVSCCFFYPCGPWFRIDGFAVNPAAPPRLKLKALELTLEQVLSYSASTGMKPMATTGVRSILRKMRQFGFVTVPGTTLVRPQRSMQGEMTEPVRAPKKTPRRRKAKVKP